MKSRDTKPSARPKKRIKLPVFRLTCLFAVVTLSFTATFAKYLSQTEKEAGAGVSPFAAGVTVKQTQPLFVFDNADYMVNDAVMNVPQNTPFTVSNSTSDGVITSVTGVDLRYSLVFYIPVAFANSAAIQILQKNSIGAFEEAHTPLFLLSDLQKNSFTTNSSRYGGVATTEESYTKSGDTFTSGTGTDTKTIKVEQVSRNAVYRYTFATKKDKVKLPVIGLTMKGALPFYKLTISRPEYILVGGSQVEHDYALRLVPTMAMTPEINSTEMPADENFSVDWLTCLATAGMVTEDTLTVSTQGWELALVGNGATRTLNMTDTAAGTTYTDVSVGVSGNIDDKYGASNGKSYPCRINAYFEQISD